MKQWTYENLVELYRYRGYSKKTAEAMARVEYDRMNKPKDDLEQYQIAQEMLYN